MCDVSVMGIMCTGDGASWLETASTEYNLMEVIPVNDAGGMDIGYQSVRSCVASYPMAVAKRSVSEFDLSIDPLCRK